MGRTEKMVNIQKQMANNEQKIVKLVAINNLLKANLLKLQQEPVKPEPVSEEKRSQQSKDDKQKFESFIQSQSTDPNNPILQLLQQMRQS